MKVKFFILILVTVFSHACFYQQEKQVLDNDKLIEELDS